MASKVGVIRALWVGTEDLDAKYEDFERHVHGPLVPS